jgi:hypothetical protein
MRSPTRRSVPDYTHRRLIDESARRRKSPGRVDFVAVDNSNRRDCRRADGAQLNALWDKRTGDENRPLFKCLLTFWSLLDLGVSKHRSGKHAGCNENCSAFRYRHLHKQKLHPGSCGVQIIEAMTMIASHKSKRGNGCCHCLSADLTKTSGLESLR